MLSYYIYLSITGTTCFLRDTTPGKNAILSSKLISKALSTISFLATAPFVKKLIPPTLLPKLTHKKTLSITFPKEVDFIGKGIAFCTSCDGAFFKGKTVAVIGGGNSAVGNALYMANLCKKVYLIDICDHLICEKTLEAKLRSLDNVEIIQETGVKELLGDDELKGIKLTNDRVIDLDGMFISIGMVAQTDLVKDLVKLSPQKYIDSEDCTTEKNGIFVAGDCRTKNIRQLTTAVADGTTAAINAIKYIENYK